MQICARDVVTTVCPTPTQFKKAQQSSDEDINRDNSFDESEDDNGDPEEPASFEPSDPLGKLLALINQVCIFVKC